MQISLNPKRYYCFTQEQQWVVSDLLRDQLVDNDQAVALISLVQRKRRYTLEQLSRELNFDHPAHWQNLVGALLKSSVLVQSNAGWTNSDTLSLNKSRIGADAVPVSESELIAETTDEMFVEVLSSLLNTPASQILLSDHWLPAFMHNDWQDLRYVVAVHDTQIMISPDFHKTCRHCFKKRILSHRPMLQFALSNNNLAAGFSATNQHNTAQQLSATSFSGEVLSMCLQAIENGLAGYDATLFYHGKFDVKSQETTQLHSSAIHSYGNCKQCYPTGLASPDLAQIQLELPVSEKTDIPESEQRNFSLTQQDYRSRSSSEVLSHLAQYVDPHVGVISRLSPYRSINDELIFNFSSGRNVAFNSNNPFWLKNHLRSASGGKGSTREQAQVSALGEAIERYAMVHNGRNPDCYGSYTKLQDKAVHPAKILNFSEAQYQQRQQNSSSHAEPEAAPQNDNVAFHRLTPAPFNEEQVVPWYSVRNLTSGENMLLAANNAFVQDPHCVDSPNFAYPDSNGCAAGSNYAEAILQGTLELIERDAAAIWWYNCIKRPAVDLSSLKSDYVNALMNYYEGLNRNIQVLDITTDIGVPCFVAVSYKQDSGTGILYGFGCHIDAQLAIVRALTEINQLLPITLTKRTQNADQGFYQWLDQQCVESHPWLYGKTTLSLQDVTTNFTVNRADKATLEQGISILIEQLGNVDVSLLMHDISPPEVRFNVVKMIAPSLRHFWRRTAPGRLYDVPVKMGWLDSPLTEVQLNEQSIII